MARLLRLECRDDDAVFGNRAMAEKRNWSALKRMSWREKFRFIRAGCSSPSVSEVMDDGSVKKLVGMKSYEFANASGSRGVFLQFVLHPGRTYRVRERDKKGIWVTRTVTG